MVTLELGSVGSVGVVGGVVVVVGGCCGGGGVGGGRRRQQVVGQVDDARPASRVALERPLVRQGALVVLLVRFISLNWIDVVFIWFSF